MGRESYQPNSPNQADKNWLRVRDKLYDTTYRMKWNNRDE